MLHIYTLQVWKYQHVFLVLCEEPTLENGHVNTTTSLVAFGYYSVGTNVFFTCYSGYKLDGSNFGTCLANGSWNVSYPTCTQGNEIK